MVLLNVNLTSKSRSKKHGWYGMIEDRTGWKYESLPVTCWHVPLWKYYSVGMIIPNIWKNEIHVPNHQPDEMHRKLCCYDVKRGSINQNMTKKYDLSPSWASYSYMVQCSVLLDLPWYGSPRPIPRSIHCPYQDHPQGCLLLIYP